MVIEMRDEYEAHLDNQRIALGKVMDVVKDKDKRIAELETDMADCIEDIQRMAEYLVDEGM